MLFVSILKSKKLTEADSGRYYSPEIITRIKLKESCLWFFDFVLDSILNECLITIHFPTEDSRTAKVILLIFFCFFDVYLQVNIMKIRSRKFKSRESWWRKNIKKCLLHMPPSFVRTQKLIRQHLWRDINILGCTSSSDNWPTRCKKWLVVALDGCIVVVVSNSYERENCLIKWWGV